ncbi:MAG: hypothetical protein SV375_08680 [Thermodesulfobacteriota bacterium]|nr:hypothetical protein [Thermodesulfobacteriota bacterium]
MAGRLLCLHPLRAADPFRLAAALIWAEKYPIEHHFVCLDNRLRDAARDEGFTLLTSNAHEVLIAWSPFFQFAAYYPTF